MTKVLVLAGGNSSEREVSLRSGAVVKAALEEAGFSSSLIDPTETLDNYLSELEEADVVFPALHGHGGEDGEVQAFLEEHDIAFVGSGSDASRLCFNKFDYLELMKTNGIRVPETQYVTREQFTQSELSKSPFVLKPNDDGSSIDTLIVRDRVKLDDKTLDSTFARHSSMLLEPLIEGIEITVAILGDKALPVIEIIPPSDEEFNYENKYNGKSQELCPPLHVDTAVQAEAGKLAEEIHKLTDCRDMSRTDMIVDGKGQIYVLETNTIPGLTEQSLLPKAASTAGININELCRILVEAALARA